MSQPNVDTLLEDFEANDVELAGQLLSLRQTPSRALRQRIQSVPHQQIQVTRLAPRLIWGSAALVVAVLLFASPSARAMLGQFEQIIGRIHLTMMDVLPTRPEPVVIESTPVSLTEAQASVSFDFVVPTNLPAGLSDEAEIFVIELEMPIIKLRWRDREGGFVQLSAHPANDGNSLTQNLIGVASSETFLINGQEAVVIHGGWDETKRTWSHQAQVTTLIWELNGIQYNLLSYSDVVSLAELIEMAKSVR
jgi:hypothetical protein